MIPINEAINENRKISFQYFKYNVRKEKQLRHKGHEYILIPLNLVWNGDHYSIMGLRNEGQEIICFRVDCVAGCPQILDEEVLPAPEEGVLSKFMRKNVCKLWLNEVSQQ